MGEIIGRLKSEKWLTLTGVLGIVLGIGIQFYIAFFGAKTGIEGDLTKAVSFDLALGIFMMTTAIIVSYANFKPRSLYTFRWFYMIAAFYSYGLETIQHFRGINPRFSQVGSPIDQILGAVFALLAIFMIFFYGLLARQFFLKGSMAQSDSNVILGIRYGMISTFLAFAAGLWISLLQSRYTGASGNIIWLHGLGFHGLQLIPLIAWLLGKQKHYSGTGLIHFSGVMWIICMLLIGYQTFLGKSIFEFSTYSILASIAFLYCLLILSKVTLAVFYEIKGNRGHDVKI